MKTMKNAILLAILLGAVSTGMIAASVEKVSSVDNRLILTPSKVVQPKVFEHELGQVVKVRFTVTEDGKTRGVTALSKAEEGSRLNARVEKAVRGWEFSPVMRNGQAVPVTVEMPVEISDIDYQ